MAQDMSISEEIYTHKYLWRAADLMLKEAKTNKERSPSFILSALHMSYMAFEAFINFCGFVLFPEFWTDEKKIFKGRGGGIEAKISKIRKRLTDFDWQNGKKLYQSVRELKDFRDLVSHGKVIASTYKAIPQEDGSHIKWEHPWDMFISIEKAESSMRDIKSFCQALLEAMRKRSDHPHVFFNAFEGPRASAEGR